MKAIGVNAEEDNQKNRLRTVTDLISKGQALFYLELNPHKIY